MSNTDVQAGTGDHRSYLIKANDSSRGPLRPNCEYLAVEAASWFVNHESGWFRDRMATGTLSVLLEAGPEAFDVALGLYELDGGARLSPVTDRAIMPERAYRGGRLTLRAHISGVSRDAAIGKLLRGASTASLAVAATLIQTSTAMPGLSQVLGAAGSALVGGVRDALDSKTERMRLFEPSTGIERTLNAPDLSGSVTYVLLHRGRLLDSKLVHISVQDDGLIGVDYDGGPLRDGVWLLLRVRRSSEYPIARPWNTEYDALWQRIYATVDDCASSSISQEEALNRFLAGSESSPSLHDGYILVRSAILGDAVLTTAERGTYAGVLRHLRELAIKSVSSRDHASFFNGLRELREFSETGKGDADLEDAVFGDVKSARSMPAEMHASQESSWQLRSKEADWRDVVEIVPTLSRLSQVVRTMNARHRS
jgi:hypothetical protein